MHCKAHACQPYARDRGTLCGQCAAPHDGGYRYSGVGSASLATQLTLETLVSILIRLAINSSFD